MAAKSKRRGKQKDARENPDLKREIAIFAVLAFCILLVASNFGFGGIVGEALSSVAFGLFGIMAYVLPFVIFGLTAFIISNSRNAHAYIKAAAAAVLFVVLAVFAALVKDPYKPGIKVAEYYKMSSLKEKAGGLVGGVLANAMRPYLGAVGTYVIIALFFIICIITITEHSLLKPLGRGGRKAIEGAKKRSKEHREKRLLREEEAKAGQRSGKADGRRAAAGIFSATDLRASKSKKKPPQFQKITLEGDDGEEAPQAKAYEEPFEDPGPEKEEMPDFPEQHCPQEEAHDRDADVKDDKGEDFSRGQGEECIPPGPEAPLREYNAPPLYLLKKGRKTGDDSDAHIRATAEKLKETLQNFGVGVQVTNASRGPSVTRYEIQPDQGVKVSRIVSLANDIKLNLAVTDLRIEAPIPGKAAVGIEVPNRDNTTVMLRDLLESDEFKNSKSDLSFAVGKDIAGKTVVADIAKMPHLLIAGATGSGKSVCINTVIMSLIFKSSPDRVKLIMIDPKVVELSMYNGIPHLLIPVVTDAKKAAGALNWAVCEVERRYRLFNTYNVRDIKGYNEKANSCADGEDAPPRMPFIVIIVDELADLMMVASSEVETAICRLAQLARAAGIHLIIATQRPSVDVITGLIKANMPSRIAFSVSSGVDSRTIIDMNGAEKLLGKGDMLFYPMGYPKPVRVQGSFVSDAEALRVVDYLIAHNKEAYYSGEVEDNVNSCTAGLNVSNADAEPDGKERDVYFADAGRLIIDKDKASIGMLQRMFRIGFNRAARIMDQLARDGVVGEEEGTKPRKILMTSEEFEQILEGSE